MALPAVKRVYDPPGADDGARILVDRLWPRGIRKDQAQVDLWLKDLAPSHDLRKRFHGQPEAWDEFRAAYAAELDGVAAQPALQTLREQMRQGRVTLLFAARDHEHNNAVALRLWLAGQRGGRRGRPKH